MLEQLTQVHEIEEQTFLNDVIAGLSQPQKVLPCKYLYDEKGAVLFDAICDTQDYYPTRSEHEILDISIEEIAKSIGPNAEVIEFGSGAGKKIRKLLTALDKPSSYWALDISEEMLLDSVIALRNDYKEIDVQGFVTDYMRPETLPDFSSLDSNKVIFFPGSTISNFLPSEARRFLSLVLDIIGPEGKLLIGVDLIKDSEVLHAAYNDSEGVTAAFNTNLLQRINRELDANFNLDGFSHNAIYNVDKSRIEMHLVSLRQQCVKIDDHIFDFETGETIHTENSHKYSVESFYDLVKSVGLKPQKTWLDKNNYFSVHCVTAS